MDASEPAPVKLIVGMLAGRVELLDAAAGRLAEAFGPVDLVSRTWDFDFTDYYAAQMGPDLLRRFVGFERPVRPEDLGGIKRQTGAIEAAFARDGAGGGGPPRPVNLDPGYVAESKLVLASTKDFAHRVYLGGGIFAEVTMTYARGAWRPLPHTFPDYAAGTYDAFLSAARDRLRARLGRKGARA